MCCGELWGLVRLNQLVHSTSSEMDYYGQFLDKSPRKLHQKSELWMKVSFIVRQKWVTLGQKSSTYLDTTYAPQAWWGALGTISL